MNQIRVNSGITVEVNDLGETITINTDDQSFINRFYGIIQKLEDVKAKVNGADLQHMEQKEQLEYLIAQTKDIMDSIDEVFGAGACKKVFGDIVPTPFLIADFFEQMVPIVEQYTKKRKSMISARYNRATRRAAAKTGKSK